jgi:hypothetical protein
LSRNIQAQRPQQGSPSPVPVAARTTRRLVQHGGRLRQEGRSYHAMKSVLLEAHGARAWALAEPQLRCLYNMPPPTTTTQGGRLAEPPGGGGGGDEDERRHEPPPPPPPAAAARLTIGATPPGGAAPPQLEPQELARRYPQCTAAQRAQALRISGGDVRRAAQILELRGFDAAAEAVGSRRHGSRGIDYRAGIIHEHDEASFDAAAGGLGLQQLLPSNEAQVAAGEAVSEPATAQPEEPRSPSGWRLPPSQLPPTPAVAAAAAAAPSPTVQWEAAMLPLQAAAVSPGGDELSGALSEASSSPSCISLDAGSPRRARSPPRAAAGRRPTLADDDGRDDLYAHFDIDTPSSSSRGDQTAAAVEARARWAALTPTRVLETAHGAGRVKLARLTVSGTTVSGGAQRQAESAATNTQSLGSLLVTPFGARAASLHGERLLWAHPSQAQTPVLGNAAAARGCVLVAARGVVSAVAKARAAQVGVQVQLTPRPTDTPPN